MFVYSVPRFNNEESYERCVAAYSRHQGLYG